MFDELLRQLEKLNGQTIAVSISLDADGYLDRRCPASNCQGEFKVLNEDWRSSKVSDDVAYCTYCGGKDAPPSFHTEAQRDHIRQTMRAVVGKAIHSGMKADAQQFNRRQPRKSFISMRMEVRSSTPVVPLPPAALELLRVDVACAGCACRYRVIGAAFFCPACGKNSGEHTFDQSIDRVRRSIALLETLTNLDRDQTEALTMQLVEGGLSDVVTAFQRWAETAYRRLPGAGATMLAPNVFQRLDGGSNAWRDAGGSEYTTHLSAPELDELRRLFQQRHVLEHCEGFVDQRYIDRGGDTTYVVGQRLVVRKDAVLRLADLVMNLVTGLRGDLP